jgi:hypothetical protein
VDGTLSERDPGWSCTDWLPPALASPLRAPSTRPRPGPGLGPTRFTCPESANLCILSERLTLVAATSFNGQILLQCLFVQCGVLHDFQMISNIKVRIKNAYTMGGGILEASCTTAPARIAASVERV